MKKKKLKKELNKTTDKAFEYMEVCKILRDENTRLESENEDLKVRNKNLRDSAAFFVKKSSSMEQKLAKRKECCKRLNAERKKTTVDLSPILPEVPVMYYEEQVEKSRKAMENAVELTRRQEEADRFAKRFSASYNPFRNPTELEEEVTSLELTTVIFHKMLNGTFMYPKNPISRKLQDAIEIAEVCYRYHKRASEPKTDSEENKKTADFQNFRNEQIRNARQSDFVKEQKEKFNSALSDTNRTYL